MWNLALKVHTHVYIHKKKKKEKKNELSPENLYIHNGESYRSI